MSYNSQTELFQFADCQRVEQATTGRCGGTVNRHVQEQAGSTLARYGHSKLTGYIAHQPQVTTHTHTFNGHFSGTTQVSRYQKGKTSLHFTEARDSERQWHQLGHMQVCTSLQTDNHASIPPLSFLQARCLSCRPTNSVKALEELALEEQPQVTSIK